MPCLIRPFRRAVLLALAALLALALPASAHPFVRGGEAPVDSLAEVTLAMAHGCGTEDAGGGDPTTEIAMEVPEDVRIVEVAEVEGYAADLEQDDDGRTEVVTWTATDGGVPAPDLPFEAVFSGEPGDEVYLKVFQGCDGFSYRWIGTPDEPADDPAVRLQLIEADPDRPAPDPEPAPEPDPEPEAPEPEDGGERDDDLEDADAADEPDADEDSDTPDAATDVSDEEPLDAAVQDTDEAGLNIVLITTIVLLVIATVAAVLAARSRRQASDGGPQDA